MKKTTWLIVLPFAFMACNNDDSSKDSVQKADSANDAKMDMKDTSNNMAKPPIQADAATADFMVKAANGGMTEVQLGQLAQEKGAAQNVKDFGAMMVQDHSAVNAQMKTLAMQRSVTLPDNISSDNKKDMDDLAKKSAKDFDKAYVKQMIHDHEQTLDLFKKASDDVKDAEVKALIDNTIPKIQHHLDEVKMIQKNMK